MSEADSIQQITQPLNERADDYDSLLELIGHARFVLLGEASHGDVIIHIDETRAVEPLERASVWDKGELPETCPSGI